MLFYILEVYVIRKGKHFWDQSSRSENKVLSKKKYIYKYMTNTFEDRQNDKKIVK